MRNLILTVAALSTASAAYAQVAYNNFGVGGSYNTTSGWTVGGPFPDKERVAMQFTSGVTGIVAGVRFASWYVSGSTDLDIVLRQDSAGTLGAVMKSWSITKSTSSATITALTNADPAVIVNSGSTYWLDISTNTDGYHAWNLNDQGDMGLRANSIDNGSTWTYVAGSTLGVFDVRTTPVPEPGSMVALGLGASALIARRKRKRA